jgi:uncharacterized membrane protein YraQ (UPF0718 family)
MTQLVLTLNGWRDRVIGLDRVWLFLGGLYLALFLFLPAQAVPTGEFALRAFVGILPFLFFAIAAAAYTKASGTDNLIARAFTGRVGPMVLFGALMGALSPLCSCGVIPLIAALLAMGVPLPPVMAFWLASPLMDPAKFALTAGAISPEFAVAQTIAAIGVGLLGGYGVWLLSRRASFASPLRPDASFGCCGGGVIRNPKEVRWAFWREEERRTAFAREGLSSFVFLSKWLLLAFTLESLMLTYIPSEKIAAVAGDGNAFAIVIGTLAGIPAYLNGYAAIPLVGGLIENGMQPGAGMAFLIAGGVTSLPAALAVFAIARVPVFLSYLFFAVTGSLLAGFAFAAFVG